MDTNTSGKSYVVALGTKSAAITELVAAAATRTGHACVEQEVLDASAHWLEEAERRPTAILVNMDDEHVTEHVRDVRRRRELSGVPIIGIALELSDLTFETAFAAGIDDCAPFNVRPLARRIATIDSVEPASPHARDEVVLIADEDRDSRLLIGRVFRDAGYRVDFAVDADDTMRRAAAPPVRIVVVSAAMDRAGGGPPLHQAASAGEDSPVWIISTPPKDIPDVHTSIDPALHARVLVHDAFTAPATMLFLANEALGGRRLREARGSERLLHGTSVRFRTAGSDREETGYCFNLSGGGLYVRTLAPPPVWEELWLEFLPPKSSRLVHLEATVAWARPFGPGSVATVPCGFGVKITGGSSTDMKRYTAGYRDLLEERVARRERMLLSEDHVLRSTQQIWPRAQISRSLG